MNMNLKNTVVCFVLHLGVLLSVTAEVIEKNVVGGKPVVLHCEDGENPNPTFTWKHNKKEVLKYMNSKVYKVDKSSKYTYAFDSKSRNFSLELLPEVEEGIYTCITNGKEISFDLKVWKVKGSQSGYVFLGETLKLELHSSSAQHIETEWFSPQKTKVPRSEGRWKLQNNNRILEIKELQFQDHGNWECRVQSPGLSIPYDVKVIGFLNSLEPETKFAAADSSINFSCVLNIKPPELPKTLIWRRMVNETVQEERLLINDKNNLTEKVIHSVQAEDAGRYQCVLNFMNKELNKTFHVVVMHISRMKEALCCHISGPTLPMAQLCWIHTRMTICDPSFLEGKFCYTPETAGLWNCSLRVENDVKISMYYTLEDKEGEDHKFPWTEVTTGSGVLLFLLLLIITGICVVTSKSFKRRRQHAMRMAQAKQHLLAKKTCQCHRELTNDYYHA